jgi:hypothetical protein
MPEQRSGGISGGRKSSGLPDDQVDRALHASLLDLESKRDWLWLQNINSTLAMASDDQKLAEPADLREPSSRSLSSIPASAPHTTFWSCPRSRGARDARGTSNGFPAQYNRSERLLLFR